MSNKPFDIAIANTRGAPLSDVVTREGAYPNNSLRYLLRQLTRQRGANWTNGAGANNPAPSTPTVQFVADGMRPYAEGGAMEVMVRPGLALVNSPETNTNAVDLIEGLGDWEQLKPVVLNEAVTFTVPANASGNPRIDIIEMRVNRLRIDSTGQTTLSPVTGVFGNNALAATLTYSLDGYAGVTDAVASVDALSYREGVPDAVPVAPTPTSGYVAVGYVYVDNAAVSIEPEDVRDLRYPLQRGDEITVKVVYAGGATGGLVEAGTLVDAPPGYTVVVEARYTAAAFNVYVFGPVENIAVTPVAALGMPTANDKVLMPAISSSALYTRTSAEVTDLADPANASPDVISLRADWTRAWRVQVQGRVYTAGGGFNNAVSANDVAYLTLRVTNQGSI